jgi:ubiquitin-activating enzyme E1
MICGFVCLELYKVHAREPLPISAFRSGFVNLACASISLSEPPACPVKVCPANGRGFTLWDKWFVEGDLTVEQFVAAVKEKYGLDVDSLLIGSELVFASFFPPGRFSRYDGRPITDICVRDAGLKISAGRSFLQLNPVFTEDVETPDFYLKYQ